jgi:hypothetical protein
MYTVDLWSCEPLTDDGCNTGDDFTNRESAERAFKLVCEALERGERIWHSTCAATGWVVLDGPDVHKEYTVKAYSPEPDNGDDWRREAAMQAGMAFGCDGYNDAMGY